MKTLAIISQKGGTGKSTVAVHLSVAASQAGHTTAVIDLDPQANVAKWGDMRNDDAPIVISAHASRLKETLHTAEGLNVDIAILDTPPKMESSTLDAARVADFALIPCRTSLWDLQAIAPTIELAKLANVETRLLFNAVQTNSSVFYKMKKAVSVFEVPCAPCHLGHRVAFSHAIIDGLVAQEYEPRGKASLEVNALYNYVKKELEI